MQEEEYRYLAHEILREFLKKCADGSVVHLNTIVRYMQSVIKKDRNKFRTYTDSQLKQFIWEQYTDGFDLEPQDGLKISLAISPTDDPTALIINKKEVKG